MNLLKKQFDLWCRMRWLKEIDREVKKRDKYYEQYKRHDYIAKGLLEEYNKLYPQTLCDFCEGEK
jgi:hypothetical protein